MNSPFTRLEIQPRNQSCGAWNRVSSSRLSSLEESPDRAASGCEELGASHESHLANLSWMAERGGHDAGGGARLPPGAEQRAQLLGRLWWAGPTPADGELLCSAAAATLGGGSTFHAEKLESCEEKTSPRRVGGERHGQAHRWRTARAQMWWVWILRTLRSCVSHYSRHLSQLVCFVVADGQRIGFSLGFSFSGDTSIKMKLERVREKLGFFKPQGNLLLTRYYDIGC